MSEWLTQKPIEDSHTAKSMAALQERYDELLGLHSALLYAMFEHDATAIQAAYTKSMANPTLKNRTAIDSVITNKSTTVPFFLVKKPC